MSNMRAGAVGFTGGLVKSELSDEFEAYQPGPPTNGTVTSGVPPIPRDESFDDAGSEGKAPSTSYSDPEDENDLDDLDEHDSEDEHVDWPIDEKDPSSSFDPSVILKNNFSVSTSESSSVKFGLGDFLTRLRSGDSMVKKERTERTMLTSQGDRIRQPKDLPICRISEVVQRVALGDNQEPCDLPPPPRHPIEVNAVRKLIRSNMIRCKRCKNRFVEKNLYERHLRERHPKDYIEYLEEQEAEMEQQRLEELEANRIEELQTGGFIPPADDIQANNFEVEVEGIPLPGENNGGVAPRFDSFGRLKALRRRYRKKVSPQCPFCDKRFRNEYSLKKHFIKKHPDHIDFMQCIKCFKCCKDKEELDAHECELTYVCFECRPIRNLCSDQRLLNHRRKFHRGANSGFRCNLCNLKFLTPRKLRKHKKMSHVFTKTYQCHFCEEIFVSEVSVMTHERIHTGIIKFECKICDYKCNRFVQMEEHMKNEHGYICAICQEKFAEWAEIKNHTLTDHGGYLTTDSSTGYIESPRVWVMFKGE